MIIFVDLHWLVLRTQLTEAKAIFIDDCSTTSIRSRCCNSSWKTNLTAIFMLIVKFYHSTLFIKIRKQTFKYPCVLCAFVDSNGNFFHCCLVLGLNLLICIKVGETSKPLVRLENWTVEVTSPWSLDLNSNPSSEWCVCWGA